MADPDQLRPILQHLLAVHESSFHLGEYEVSFHALSAAAHAAQRLEDLEMLEHIATLSREKLGWIDAHDRQHRLGSQSAGRRRHQSVFEQLAVTATTMGKRIHAEQVRRAAAEAVGAHLD
jgi:hypothetical protein